MHLSRSLGAFALLLSLASGCSDGEASSKNCSGANCSPPTTQLPPCQGVNCATPEDKGNPLSVALAAEQQQQLDALHGQLDAAKGETAEQLVAERALPFAASLSYDPLTAQGLDLIEKSSVAPSQDELARLKAQGFSISGSKTFPTFTYGYASIYLEDLPVYISADSLLHAAHKSYDKGLAAIESSTLRGNVQAMLTTMRSRLGSGAAAWMPKESRSDLDLILALGASLLGGQLAPLVGDGDKELLSDLFAKAVAGKGATTVRLFGTDRKVDFSQFTPRGHYTQSEELKNYFRAMMWFGRTEFRLIETDENSGQQIFRRRQLEAALGLVELLDDEARQRFERVDRTIGLFVGEHDSMTPLDAAKFLADLGLSDGSGLASLGDEQLAQKLVDGGYGAQRIASQLMVNDRNKTLPLHRAFQLFGQRYTVDSHVFSNVVFDRAGGGAIKRMMPSPLDAAFAALGNDQAASLLSPELSSFGYAPDLASMRLLVDAHEPAYWDGSLYTLWMSSLRALSPSRAELSDPKASGLPSVATTEAWGRRMLNTQAASWAELRHDTLLYAKQSYTGGASCEFPDAYVDPYPAFYERLARYAERGQQLVDDIPSDPGSYAVDALRTHFKSLRSVALQLKGMAEQQRTGQPFTAEQMAFINDAVVLKTENQGCVPVTTAKGWYPSLILGDPLEYDPTIADVHTQPTEANGEPVGKVLHVATGMPRRMLVTVETCSGPRAYVGLTSSYSEKITLNYERLTDEQWVQELQGQNAPPTAWVSDLVGP